MTIEQAEHAAGVRLEMTREFDRKADVPDFWKAAVAEHPAARMRAELLALIVRLAARLKSTEQKLGFAEKSFAECKRRRERDQADLAAAQDEAAIYKDALLTICEHHERLNNRVMRPLDRSHTLSIARGALARYQPACQHERKRWSNHGGRWTCEDCGASQGVLGDVDQPEEGAS